MKIEWLAHACFILTTEGGKTIVFDPFDESIGYKRMDAPADYVFISHDHKGHNCLDHLKGDYKVFREPGEQKIDDLEILGIETPTKNITFKVTTEGMSIAHLGDLDHIPDADFFEKLGHVDVLFVPVGGTRTLNAEQAFEVCKKIEPNIIIPMHYKTMFLELSLDPVYNFTDVTKTYYDRARLGTSAFSITAGTMKKRSRIIVLDCHLDELL